MLSYQLLGPENWNSGRSQDFSRVTLLQAIPPYKPVPQCVTADMYDMLKDTKPDLQTAVCLLMKILLLCQVHKCMHHFGFFCSVWNWIDAMHLCYFWRCVSEEMLRAQFVGFASDGAAAAVRCDLINLNMVSFFLYRDLQICVKQMWCSARKQGKKSSDCSYKSTVVQYLLVL